MRRGISAFVTIEQNKCKGLWRAFENMCKEWWCVYYVFMSHVRAGGHKFCLLFAPWADGRSVTNASIIHCAPNGGACDIRERQPSTRKTPSRPKWFMSPEEIKIAFNPSEGENASLFCRVEFRVKQFCPREKLEFPRARIKLLNYHMLTGASWRTSRLWE